MQRFGFAFVVLIAVACSSTPVVPDASTSDASADVHDSSSFVDALPGGPCTSGDKRCNGNGVESCVNDQWGGSEAFVPCTNQTCSAGACIGVCASEQTRCNGASIETCDATGEWKSTQTCPVACCNSACIDTSSDTSNCGGCGIACASTERCDTGFTAFTGSAPTDWTMNGSASYDGSDNAGQLTDLGMSEAGTWIFNREFFVDSMTIQFDFYIGDGTGADGMAVMLETNGTTALGPLGGGLALVGLSGFGVELDEYDNAECLDDNTNHIAIDTLDACGDGVPTSLVVNDSPGFTLADSTWHTMTVDIASGAFTVKAEGNTEFSAYTPTGWASGKYWLGFAGATGGATNYHRFRNVHVTFPTARCY